MLLDMQIYMPAQDPLAQPDIAFTPRKVKQWVKSLSLVDLDAASNKTLNLIAASNRHSYPAKQRYKSMELIQSIARTVLEYHRRYLACQSFPLSPNANEIFQLQQQLTSEIAIAYKIIITEVINHDSKLGQKKLLHCIYRAVTYLQQQYISGLLMYQQIAPAIWHDICQLYRVAEHYGLQNTTIIDEDSKQKTCIHNIFKHLCASTLISFNKLRQGEAEKVNKFLQRNHELIDISNSTENLDGAHIYIANLATGKKPTYYIPREMPISTQNRFIGYSALVRKLAESTKKFTQSASYYLQSNEELDPDLASRLISMIGNPSQRQKKRIKSDKTVSAIIGLKRITQAMNTKIEDSDNNNQDSSATSSLSLLPIEEVLHKHSSKRPNNSSGSETFNDLWNPYSSSQQTISEAPDIEESNKSLSNKICTPETWHVANINAGGFCLYYKADDMRTTRVGEVIAIQDEVQDSQQWHIGIIRWMQCLADKKHKVGVELFGAESACIKAHNKDNSHEEYDGLLLKRIIDNNKSYCLLLPPNSTLDSREIIIRGSSSERTIMLGRTLEKTSCFSNIEAIKIFSNNDNKQT